MYQVLDSVVAPADLVVSKVASVAAVARPAGSVAEDNQEAVVVAAAVQVDLMAAVAVAVRAVSEEDNLEAVVSAVVDHPVVEISRTRQTQRPQREKNPGRGRLK